MTRTRKKTPQNAAPPAGRKGTLFVVATPIGNLEDITLRALRILKEVDLIAAEDTRHTRKLLNHFGIATPALSYYKEKEEARAAVIIGKLLEGLNIALVSDAGTPGISDPGAILVQKAVAADIRIEPVPGPSSLTAALSVAGLPDHTFLFLGFAPARRKQRRDLLESLRLEQHHLVFFEAPHRLQKFLYDCHDLLGDRQAFWCRELTKIHEELARDTLSGLLDRCHQNFSKGESVFIIAGASSTPVLSDAAIAELLAACRQAGRTSLKDAVQEISMAHQLSRSRVYKIALQIWGR